MIATSSDEKKEMRKLANFLKDEMSHEQLVEYSLQLNEVFGDDLAGRWDLKFRIAKQVKRDVEAYYQELGARR